MEQAAPSGITYQLDLTSGALQWGNELQSALGYPLDATVNSVEWWTSHIHPEDAMILNDALDGLTDPAATGWAVSYRLRKADNTYVGVHDQATIVRSPDGEPLSLSGVMTLQA